MKFNIPIKQFWGRKRGKIYGFLHEFLNWRLFRSYFKNTFCFYMRKKSFDKDAVEI